MLLVVGWDGACWELARPLLDAGRMPVLKELLGRGSGWRVRSTVPAVTFPAWTSFLTGAEPAHHGITDFTIARSGSYGVRFVNSSHRAMPTILSRMADTGLRVGMYGVPATFPPEGRCVFEICGFDTPLGATAGGRATFPSALADQLRSVHGRLGVEGISQSRIDSDWHARTRPRLLEDIDLRTRISCELMAAHDLDAFVVHFMESDTASHHFWQFDDAASPRHRSGESGTLGEVYAALDRSLGRLLAAAGPDADVLLLSDHGSAGASDRVVFWNRWLADHGWLKFSSGGGSVVGPMLKKAALRLLPESLQARAFQLAGGLADRVESSARFAGINWAETRVYSDEVPYFPSLRLNLVGREPSGSVEESEREAVVALLTEQLLAARDPFDGLPVVEAVRRREDLFEGPFADRYPDLILDLRRPDGYAYGAGSSHAGKEANWLRHLREDERSGAKGSGTSGVHSDHGMAVIASAKSTPVSGAKVTSGARTKAASDTVSVVDPVAGVADASRLPECSLPDLGVTALALAGVARSGRMQGRSLVVASAELRLLGTEAGGDDPQVSDALDYTEAEAREVEERLRSLGYLP